MIVSPCRAIRLTVLYNFCLVERKKWQGEACQTTQLFLPDRAPLAGMTHALR